MELLRERVRCIIEPWLTDRHNEFGWGDYPLMAQDIDEKLDAILQAVEEDRAALKEWHEEIAQSQQRWRARAEKAEAREAALVAELDALKTSRDSWMNDFSALATRMDKFVSLLASAEAREAALREAAQELWNAVAHDVTDESKWVGTAMGKLQAVLASVGK